MLTIEFFAIFQVLETIVYVFHISILYMLFKRRKTTFLGPFYSILRYILLMDVIVFLTFSIRFRWGAVNPFAWALTNSTFVATALFDTIGYITFVQYVGQLLLAFNRFTSLMFPLGHRAFWKKPYYLIVLFGVPFLCGCYRLHEPAKFIIHPNNELNLININPDIIPYVNISTYVVYFTSTSLCCIFNLVSLIKIFALQSNASVAVHEKRLLFMSCAMLIAQICRILVSMIRYMFTVDAHFGEILFATFPLSNDIFAWCGSFSLLFLSQTARHEYLSMYFGKSKSNVVTISATNTNTF